MIESWMKIITLDLSETNTANTNLIDASRLITPAHKTETLLQLVTTQEIETLSAVSSMYGD